jgi:hypothetical protein
MKPKAALGRIPQNVFNDFEPGAIESLGVLYGD